MKPIDFPGVNLQIGKNQPEYRPLPAMHLNDSLGTVITCWELSDEEIETIVKSRKFYLKHLTFNLSFQPILPVVDLSDGIELI